MNQSTETVEEAVGLFFGYRKFVVMLLLLVVGVVFRVENLIDGGQFVDLIKATALAFIGGNIGEHAAGVAKQWVNTLHPQDSSPAKEVAVDPDTEE